MLLLRNFTIIFQKGSAENSLLRCKFQNIDTQQTIKQSYNRKQKRKKGCKALRAHTQGDGKSYKYSAYSMKGNLKRTRTYNTPEHESKNQSRLFG